MNDDVRRVKLVQAAIESLVEAGSTEFRPGDVASHQRKIGDPIPVWEIRGIFTTLASQGVIEVDAKTGAWSTVGKKKGGKKSAAAG